MSEPNELQLMWPRWKDPCRSDHGDGLYRKHNLRIGWGPDLDVHERQSWYGASPLEVTTRTDLGANSLPNSNLAIALELAVLETVWRTGRADEHLVVNGDHVCSSIYVYIYEC